MATETAMVTVKRVPMAQDPASGPKRLVEAFLARRSAATTRAYRSNLRDFAAFLEVPGPAEAVAYLLGQGPGPANELALTYQSALAARGLSAATSNHRLSTLRAVVKLAKTLGLCAFSIEIQSERGEQYRDTRGPGADAILAMLGTLQDRARRGKRQAVRDLAIVRLLLDRGLRRGEVVSLDVEHYDRENCRLSIHGKGRASREWVTLSAAGCKALDAWLEVRGDAPGPLFIPLDRAARYRGGGGRLSGASIWHMLRRFGIRPHGLRHAAVTEALRLTGGDIPRAMRFSRHKSPAVLMVYDDRRTDDGGKLAEMIGERFDVA